MFTFCTGRTKDSRGVWKKTTYFQPQQSLLNRGGGLRHTHLILISGAGHSRVGQGRIPTVSHCGDDSLLASRYEYNKQTHVQIGWSNNQDQIPSQPERLPKLKICGMFPKSTSPFLMNVFPGIIFCVSTALGRFWHTKFNSTKFFKSKVLKIILTNISKWNNNQKNPKDYKATKNKEISWRRNVPSLPKSSEKSKCKTWFDKQTWHVSSLLLCNRRQDKLAQDKATLFTHTDNGDQVETIRTWKDNHPTRKKHKKASLTQQESWILN